MHAPLARRVEAPARARDQIGEPLRGDAELCRDLVGLARDEEDALPLEVGPVAPRPSSASAAARHRRVAEHARGSPPRDQTKNLPSTPSESASWAEKKPPDGMRHLAQHVVERLLA